MATKVLIIDDDEGIRESLKDLLSLEHFECSAAKSGTDGLALVALLKPQLVVTDIQLPDMSGYELCQRLKKDPSSSHVAIVMMSGHFTEKEDKLQGFDLGAEEFFSKPFDPHYFVARVKSILRRTTSASQAA